VALVALTATACGGSGSSKLTPVQADQQRVQAMTLKLADFKTGWTQVTPNSSPGACEPDLSGFPPTAGQWNSAGVKFKRGADVTALSNAIVLRSPSDADLAFLQLTGSGYVDCAVRTMASTNVKGLRILNVRSRPLKPQPLADAISGFRVIAMAKANGKKYGIYVDTLVVRQDRALARFRFISLVKPGDQDSEWRLAQVAAKRGLAARQ
jgi:hypothetical protein